MMLCYMVEKSSKKKVHCVILAAGMGTRMVSNKSKVLHCVSGMPMVEIVLNIARKVANYITVVASEENFQQIEKLLNVGENIVLQKDRLGTGHAVFTAFAEIEKSDIDDVLVLYADTPLVTEKTLQDLIKFNNYCTFLGFYENDANNKYGRFVVDGEMLLKIVEYKDANENERSITLCNSGVICAKKDMLLDFLQNMQKSDITNEYYLTDLAKFVTIKQKQCKYIVCNKEEVLGVNSRIELASVDSIMQNRVKNNLMLNGVTIIMPQTTYINIDAKIAKDVIIEPNCFIGKNVVIEENVVIYAFSYIEDCVIKSGANVGPYARIRPKTVLENNARIGNFVEVKNTTVGKNSKINHLTYVGDAKIGENCNIGAGTIFCNYDGFNKFESSLGDNVFVGSNSTIISPIEVADGTIIGAGSVVVKSTNENDLVIARCNQQNIQNGAKKFRNKRQ